MFKPVLSGQAAHLGFTLAEVLVTLGIIGVVAALTLPALVNNTQNKEIQTQFKKLYSELNQASRLFMNDFGVSVTEYCRDKGTSSFVRTLLPKYLKGLKLYDDTTSGSKDEEGNAKSSAYQMYTLGGAKLRLGPCDDFGYMTDIAGRIYSFEYNGITDEQQGPVVCIDVNGHKRPNKFGYDIFIFRFVENGLVLPMGQEYKAGESSYGVARDGSSNNFFSKNECKVSSDLTNQLTCAKYALADVHPFEKGKNYWQDFLGKNR